MAKKKAVTRTELCIMTGLSDRKVRWLISKARREHPILNLQDSEGYFRPTIQEYLDAKQFYKQEHNRAMSILWSLAGLKKWIKEIENGRKKNVFEADNRQ